MKKYAFVTLVFFLLTGSFAGSALSQESYQDPYMTERGEFRTGPDGESVLFDLIFLRPAGILATAVGLIGSVAITPFAITSTDSKAYKGLVAEPFAYTFKRPLGESGVRGGRIVPAANRN
jgi:hypothetical protein